MPIFIKDFEWDQNDSSISVSLNIPRVKKCNLSALCASKYLKINCKPYIWEAFLHKSILPDSCSICISEDAVHIQVEKNEKTSWELLTDQNCREKSIQKELRQLALDEIEVRQKDNLDKQKEIRIRTKDFLIQEIIRKENDRQKRVDNEKKAERDKMDKQVRRMKEGFSSMEKRREGDPREVDAKQKNLIPEPRKPGKIAVTFTPRALPTAARESLLQQESGFQISTT